MTSNSNLLREQTKDDYAAYLSDIHLLPELKEGNFEKIFNEKFDFFSTIFEYLIKDYNTNSGGKYAEYFTPHSVSKIMAKCLVKSGAQNVSCFDPSAGSGTLLMNLANVRLLVE